MHYHSIPIDTLNLLAENRGKRTKKAYISHNFLGGGAGGMPPDPPWGISSLAPYLFLNGHSEIPS